MSPEIIREPARKVTLADAKWFIKYKYIYDALSEMLPPPDKLPIKIIGKLIPIPTETEFTKALISYICKNKCNKKKIPIETIAEIIVSLTRNRCKKINFTKIINTNKNELKKIIEELGFKNIETLLNTYGFYCEDNIEKEICATQLILIQWKNKIFYEIVVKLLCPTII